MHIASIGIDIGKTAFHLVALDEYGSVVVRKKFSRKQLPTYTANLSASLIGIEACGGAHGLARVLRNQGHNARLMPGQPQVQQERLSGCGSDCRSRLAQQHALCADQDRRPTRSAGTAPGAGTTGA